MAYYFSKTLSAPFEDVLARTAAALKGEGFGILNEIDVQQTLKDKIDANFRPYVILGACNPKLALEALTLEDKIGTMLPCNVVVQQCDGGAVEIAAIDPVASMLAVENDQLKDAARVVGEKLKRAVAAV